MLKVNLKRERERERRKKKRTDGFCPKICPTTKQEDTKQVDFPQEEEAVHSKLAVLEP